MINTAVILSGGNSSRYGSPKGLEKVGGQTIIERLAEEIRTAGIETIYLSIDQPGQFSNLGLPTISDRFPGCGPLAGIHSALVETGADAILVLPCDLPGITSREIGIILDFAENNIKPVIFVETKSQEHPLCSVVRSNIIPELEKTLFEGKYATLKFFKSVEHSMIYFDDDCPFTNINTPEDLRHWETENVL